MVKNTGSSGADKVKFIAADFFTYSVPENERFDLIYDYTFVLSLPWPGFLGTSLMPLLLQVFLCDSTYTPKRLGGPDGKAHQTWRLPHYASLPDRWASRGWTAVFCLS